MNVKRYITVSDYINLIMLYIVSLVLISTAELYFEGSISLGAYLFVVLFLFLVKFIREKIHNSFLFISLHLIPVAAAIFIPFGMTDNVLLFLFVVLFIILDVKYIIESTDEGLMYLPLFLLVIPIICYFVLEYMGLPLASYIVFLCGVVYFMLFYVRRYITDIYLIAGDKTMTDKNLLKDMIVSDNKLILPVLVSVFAIMIIVRVPFVESLLKSGFDILMDGVSFVISLVFRFFEWIGSLLTGDPSAALPTSGDDAFVYQEPSLFVIILSYVLSAAIIVTIIVLMVKAVIRIVKELATGHVPRFESINHGDMIEVRESITRTRQHRSNDRNLNECRKKYKKTILKQVKKGYDLDVSLTPNERKNDIQKSMKNDISEITKAYEECRYKDDL